MIKIYLDQQRLSKKGTKEVRYFEDIYSAYETATMDRSTFDAVLSILNEKYEIHTRYSELVNHIGRFFRDFGKEWSDEEVAIYAKRIEDKEYKRFFFDKNGQIKEWYYGFFC